MQQFIYSSTNRACTIRLFFYNPQASHSQQHTYGFYLSNRHGYDAARLHLDERLAICTSKENSFEAFPMKGKVLEPYEAQAQSLLQFLFKSYNLRIEFIVVDFLKDERDTIFMVDVNGFRVSEYEKVARLMSLTEEEQEARAEWTDAGRHRCKKH